MNGEAVGGDVEVPFAFDEQGVNRNAEVEQEPDAIRIADTCEPRQKRAAVGAQVVHRGRLFCGDGLDEPGIAQGACRQEPLETLQLD